MSDQHPPTARGGIKSSLGKEQEVVKATQLEPQASDLQPASTNHTHEKANATGEPLLNPGGASPEADATAPITEGVFDEREGDNLGLSPQREAFVREALAAYRNMLVGLRARLRGELSTNFAGALNPEGQKAIATESLRSVRLGIARANLLLCEIDPEEQNLVVEP